MSIRTKVVIGFVAYLTLMSVFFGWYFAGHDMQYFGPVAVCLVISQLIVIWLIKKTK